MKPKIRWGVSKLVYGSNGRSRPKQIFV